MSGHNNVKKLGWFLCWAVVFADIGTSLYYVPGILFGEVANLAGLFVLMSSVVFVLLVMKYIEITDRYAEGGGVVTVASHAFGPWFGALGGMFITVDYFLTAAISSVSGFAYLNSIVHIGTLGILIGAMVGLFLLGVLNIIGIKESAGVTAVVATAAFVVDLVLVVAVATQVGPEGWRIVFASLGEVKNLTLWPMMTGFAGSFLAFSGLESISQLSPAMHEPRRKIATIAMAFVVGAIMLTSPLLTLFSTNLLTAKLPQSEETILEGIAKIKEREHRLAAVTDPVEREHLTTEITHAKEYSERFMSELGAQYGGPALKLAVVITASVLLLFAANTAIIGAYHVFIALSRQRFLPQILQTHNSVFDTPHLSVALAVFPPIAIIWATQGDLHLLGQLYAFGLLGAFGLSSVGLDVVRWKENKKWTPMLVLGLITSLLVLIAWGTNLYYKHLATLFGGAITVFGMMIAYLVHRSGKAKVVKVGVELAVEVPQGQLLVPVFEEFDPNLFEYVARHAKKSGLEVVVTYLREFRDVLQTVASNITYDQQAAKFLRRAKEILDEEKVKTHLVYRSTVDIGDSINKLRRQTHPDVTILSPHKKARVLEFLRGDTLSKVLKKPNGDVLVHLGGNGNGKKISS